MTPEQEASYEKHLESMPATPDWILGLRKDTLYKGPLEKWAKEKTQAAIPVVKPSISAHAIMSHLCGDTPDQFAAVVGQLLTPEIQDKQLIPRVPTATLPTPHITGKLRLGNITDPHIPSVGMTPHELAIVPRQRSTAQLPPHMRLHEDHSDSPEHVMPVEELINGAIVTFMQEQQRLPHGITVSLIRFYQHWLDYHYSLFTYKAEYGNVQIPIRAGAKGEFLTNEVRLD